MAKQDSLTAARLREVLHYSQETGVFTWLSLTSKASRMKIGKVAGGIDTSGHRQIKLFGRTYLAHRLAFLYMTGEWPKQEVDHINCTKDDNRWINLREATRQQNTQNIIKARSSNKSGILGAFKNKGKWESEIRHGEMRLYLGRFDTPELAHAAYLEAKAKYHEYQTLVVSK